MENYSSLGFFEPETAESRQANQIGQPAYCVLTIGRPALGSRTGIGVLVYGANGRLQAAHLDSLDRAVERRDAIDYSQVSADELDVVSLRRFIAGVPRLLGTISAARRFRDCPLQVPFKGCSHLLIEVADLRLLECDLTPATIAAGWRETCAVEDRDPLAKPVPAKPVSGFWRRLWNWLTRRS